MEPLDDMMCLAPNDVAYASYRAVEVSGDICQFNACTVLLKGKYQKKIVSDNPSMDSFTKIYQDSEKL